MIKRCPPCIGDNGTTPGDIIEVVAGEECEACKYVIEYVCADSECKDGVPTRSGSAYWDQDVQEWILNDDMEDPYCSECSGDIIDANAVT